MRILALSYLFPNSVYPDAGVFVLNRLKAISRHHEVRVINPIPWFPWNAQLRRYKDYDRIPREEILDGIQVYHPRFFSVPRILKGLDSLTYSLAVMPLARRLAQAWPYDVIDLHWTYPDLPSGWLLSRRMRLPFAATIRGREALHLGEAGLRGAAVASALRRADAVIPVSRSLRELCASLGVAKGRMTVIGNGVNNERFSHQDQGACRRRLGLALSSRIVLAVGAMTPVKGFDRLLNCFPQLLQQVPEAELCVAGPCGDVAGGDTSGSLKQQAARLGIASRVRFVGRVRNEDLVDWYNAADLFCLSSRSEGCPNVLLEALACGCPAVATCVGSAREIVADESLGVVVPNDEGSLLSGLVAALGRRYDRAGIAERLRDQGWDACARKCVSVYERMLGERRPAAAPAAKQKTAEAARPG
jgi:glycosyltransferase involved in cell wall biosynthesis